MTMDKNASLLTASTQILDLGSEFYDPVQAAPFPELKLRYENPEVRNKLGWSIDDLTKYAGRFEPVPASLPQPLALCYHGHQFQHYNPDLGDGRGFTFAQFKDQQHPGVGKLWDLGTKGSGQTPYSRQGDGRLTLKGAVREALATELLQSHGVNTSRTLVFFETGENLIRGDEPSPTRSAVLTRFSHSHIRFGSFQRLTYLHQIENLKKLFEYCATHLVPGPYPQAFTVNSEVSGFFTEVIKRSASLVAQWMTAGFVHGVLNTDNMNITGESFDYGPYRFLPHYDPQFTAAYFDHSGLYAFGEQPRAVLWNLHQLGFCLRVIEPGLELNQITPYFETELHEQVRLHFLRRLNIESLGKYRDEIFLSEFFDFMQKSKCGFELCFFELRKKQNQPNYLPSIFLTEQGKNLLKTWQDYPPKDLKKSQQPYFEGTVPVTCLIDEIEALWAPIANSDNWDLFHQKIQQIRALRGVL